MLDFVTNFCYNIVKIVKQKEESHKDIEKARIDRMTSYQTLVTKLERRASDFSEGGESDGPLKVPCGKQ